MKKTVFVLKAATLMCLAGSVATAQPVIDGKISPTDNYGPAKWVQTVPTSAHLGDNVAGAGDQGQGSLGDPTVPNTGIEIAIPYSALGIAAPPFNAGNPFPALRFAAFISSNGGDNISNQWLAGLPLNTANQGNVRALNMSAFANNQFVTLATTTNVTAAPVVDGTRDTTPSYGSATGERVQTNSTGYGDAGHGQIVFPNGLGPAGSELNAIFVRRSDSTQTLHVIMTGNLETNGNRLNLFVDSQAGGQNRLLGGLTDAPLGAMSDDGTGNGLTFDAGFEPDYLISLNSSRTTQPEGTPEANDQFLTYVDYFTLPTGSSPTKIYAGSTVFPTVAGFAGGALTGGDVGAPAIRAAINNSNIAGVIGGVVGGDFRAPSEDYAYGQEINAVYSKVESGKLFVLVTGNLRSDFSKLNLFFDGQAGGQNRLRGNSVAAQGYRGNVDIDFNGLNRLGADTIADDGTGNFVPVNGVKFDNGFEADYWLVTTAGPGALVRNPIENYSNAAVLRTGGRLEDLNGRALDYGAYDGGRKRPGNFPMDYDGPQVDPLASAANIYCNFAPRTAGSGTPVAQKIVLAHDNSNVGGVTLTSAAGAADATSGVEFAIDLNELLAGGWDETTPIRMAGFIATFPPNSTSGNYEFVGNQVIGGLPLDNTGQAANLGEPRAIDFSTIGGDQYVVLTGSPSSPCGTADLGGEGGAEGSDNILDNNDFIVFIQFFFSQDARADLGAEGGAPGPDAIFDNNDFIVFIQEFFGGSGNSGCNGNP
jgi:hypothetical protein